MIYISEEESAALVTHELAFEAVRRGSRCCRFEAELVFPAVLGRAQEATNTFSIKSGSSNDLTGVKIGSFWSGNPARGLPRHNSTIVLLDQDTGRLGAVIEAGQGQCLQDGRRRRGCGRFSCAQASQGSGDLRRRQPGGLRSDGAGSHPPNRNRAGRGPAFAAARRFCRSDRRTRAWRRALPWPKKPCARPTSWSRRHPRASRCLRPIGCGPGTHVVSMGSDAPGKHELPSELFLEGTPVLRPAFPVRPDRRVPARARRRSTRACLHVTPIGDVIEGRAPGRRFDNEITVFDSSGISLQDLYMADALIRARGPTADLAHRGI